MVCIYSLSLNPLSLNPLTVEKIAMLTPDWYTKLASRISIHKRHFLSLAAFGFLLILLPILAAAKYQLNIFPLSGIGLFAMIWGWGLFLVIQWFGSDSTKKPSKIPQLLRSGSRWYAALFLDVWFLFGCITSFLIVAGSLFR